VQRSVDWSEKIKKFSPIFAILVFSFAAFFVYRMAKHYSLQEIMNAMQALPAIRVVYSMIVMMASYLVASCYDLLAIRYIGKRLPSIKVMFTSIMAFIFTNNIGMANLAGSSVRLRMYTHYGLRPKDILALIVFISFSFWTGFLGLSGILFLTVPPLIPSSFAFSFSSLYLRALGAILVLIPILYVTICFFRLKPKWMSRMSFELPSWKIACLQVFVSALEWALAGLALYVLLPHKPELDYVQFLSVFATAQVLAMITHVPGGLGVIEAVVIFFVSGDQAPTAEAIGALLAFRCIFYFLPLLGAITSLISFEIYRKRHIFKVGR
jgi:phosphatidylglycerol lysyltransferase